MYVHYLYASHTIDHDVPTGPNGSHVNCIEPVTLMHATHTGWQKLFKHAAKNQGFQIGTLFRVKSAICWPHRLRPAHNMRHEHPVPWHVTLETMFCHHQKYLCPKEKPTTLPWKTGGPVCKGKRINHVTAASEEPDNRISVRRAASQDIPLRGGLRPAPSPPTKCPQCMHQSQYSTIPQQYVHHNISSALYLAATLCAIGDLKGSKVATAVRRCNDGATQSEIPRPFHRSFRHQHSPTVIQSILVHQKLLSTFELSECR